MSTRTWRGDAAAVKQVDTIVVAGTWATADTATITINGKTITFTVAGTQTIAAVVAGLVAAWNLSTVGEHAEISAADANPNVTLTADTAGKPFTAIVSEVTAGDGTLSISTTTANSGPADLALAANCSGATLPINSDTFVFENSANVCRYNLDTLTAVTGLVVVVDRSYTGEVGLPNQNAGVANVGYVEYRTRYLEAGMASLDVGEGEGNGNGSGRLMFDCAGSSPVITVSYTGTPKESGIPPLLITNTGATTELAVNKGSVGVAIFAGETATISVLNVGYQQSQAGDSIVVCGAGVTLTTVHQTGGKLTVESNITTFTQDGGEATIGGAATIGTATINGTVYDDSSGTWTNLTIGPTGVYDHRRSMTPKTISGLITIEDGGAFFDKFGMVTWDGFICDPEKVTLDIGDSVLTASGA